MPNNPHAISWTTEEFEKLVELVKPHTFLYNVQDPSRKNILARESTWEQISQELKKPAEECKKRWRAIRDSYMATLRMGNDKEKTGLSTKLEFLNEPLDEVFIEDRIKHLVEEETEQQVIMDNQEYYEITLVDSPETTKIVHKLPLPRQTITAEPPKKIGRKNCGRKKYQPPPPPCLQPIKILPKPVVMKRPNIMYVEETPKVLPPAPVAPKTSEALESLVEKLLKEHTNEIDVFFRSMAASVKKLQPNLIPKVKMEVCNVIAKYEMQSFEKKGSS